MYVIPNVNESYDSYINRILEVRENIKIENVYQELHHIVPKCMGGTDEKSNLIYLYGQEHYFAHKLLALENPKNYKLQQAWWNMCQCTQNGQRIYDISADDYNQARVNFAETMKGNDYALGQTLSKETRKRMSDSHKGKLIGELNPMYGKHCSDECKQKLRDKLSGGKNPVARKVMCIETGEIFDTVKAAADWCSIGHSDIAAFVRGKQKSAGKHPITKEKLHWKYIE